MRMIKSIAACMVVLWSTAVLAATDIKVVKSPGGIEAWLVEESSIPMIAIEIGFVGGSSLDPAGKTGLATLFAGLLEEGAGDLDASAYSARADEIAARFSFSAGRDTLRISARMLTENRDDSIDLLRLALTAPRFDEEPVARVKAQMASQLRSAETDPQEIASRAWFSAAFPDDAYGRNADGELADVASITADDLRAALPRLINKGAIYVGVVGDISAADLAPLLDRLLGDLPAEAPDLPGKASYASTPGIEVVELDIPQSTVLFGQAGILRSDPDFIPAYVMNYMLGGGGFASILYEEVREKRGLAYSAYSYLYPLDRAGVYLGGAGTANERVAETISVIREVWSKMATDGVTEERLERAKRYLTGAYPLRFDTNAKIAGTLMGLQMEDLGLDYIRTRNDLVEAVTVEDIKRVAAKLLDPDALKFVVVGKPQGLVAN